MDTILVERAARGDHDAFAALAAEVGDRLMAIAFRILRDSDRAADATQQALVTAWNELPQLRDPERFESWMRRITVNACYAEHRRTRRIEATIRAIPIGGSGSDPADDVADRDALDRAFRRLPLDQRAVVVYRFYLDLSLADIASELDVPLGTVKSRLHYATTALRASIEADARTTITSEQGA